MNVKVFILTGVVLLVSKGCAHSIAKQLLSRITDHHYPLYQIIVFLNKDLLVNDTFLSDIIRTLSQEIPLILIDLSKEQSSIELFQTSKFTKLHLIIDSDSDADFTKRVYNTMSLIMELTPILPRPKCLLLLRSKTVLFNLALKSILLDAWSLKFLNFSIIKFDSQYRTVVLHYNPFNQSFYANNIENTIAIFPDKLQNMNKYFFKLAVFNESSILEIRDDPQNRLKISGLHYPFFEIFAEKLNFALDYKIYDSSNYSEMLEELYLELENGNINAVPIVMVSSMVYGNKHTIGKAIFDTKLVMIVPVVSTVKLYADMDVFYHFFIFPAIVLLLCATRFCLKLTKRHWQAMNVVAILLGITLKAQPRRMAERIIFIAVVVASLSCSSDLVAKLTNVKLVTEEKLFNTVESIVDSGLPIYGMRRLIGSNESSLDYQIKSRAQFIASASDCVEIQLLNRSAICITLYTSSRLLISQTRGRYLKLAGPKFQYDFTAFPFERNSPFLEKINGITQRILEAGLHQAWEYARRTFASYSRRSEQRINEDNEIQMFELGVFLASAYSLAIIVFIGELLRHNYLDRNATKS